MSDSETSSDEEPTYAQQIKILSKSEAIKLFDKINITLQNIKEANVHKNINRITEETLIIIEDFGRFRSLASNVTKHVFSYEPIVCDLYYTFCIRCANKEIQPYIHMSKECVLEARSISDEFNS